MNKIFNTIEILLQYNGLKEKDIDINAKLSILKFAFIKSKITRMFSNLKFMELYIGDKTNTNKNHIDQLLNISDFITKLNHSDLIGVNREEFIKKCNEVIKKND